MPRSSWQCVEKMTLSAPGTFAISMRKVAGVLFRRGVADGVGDVDGGGSGLNGDGYDLDEEVGVCARRVFGGELDVFDVGAGEADGLANLVEGFGASDL